MKRTTNSNTSSSTTATTTGSTKSIATSSSSSTTTGSSSGLKGSSSSTLSRIASVKQAGSSSTTTTNSSVAHNNELSRKSSTSSVESASSSKSNTNSTASSTSNSSKSLKSTQSTPRNTNVVESSKSSIKSSTSSKKASSLDHTSKLATTTNKEDPKDSKPKATTIIEEEEIVQVLELRHQQISEIPRAHTSKIELLKLDISFNKFSELQPLERYTKLTSLKVMYNKVATLNGLETLENLRDCNMVGNVINDVSKLAFCKRLENLALDNNMIQSFPSLVSLKNLTHLSVENNCLTNFDGLSGLERLKTLSVARNSIEKLTGLGKCRFRTSLIELDLSNNNIDKADFAFLPTFEKLEVLRMKSCNFKSLEAFPPCPQIRDLTLTGNKLESVLWIETKFSGLESLTIKDNYLPHVKQLQEELSRLTNLEMVAVSGNPLCDINSNYVKILSTHLKNLRMIDEVAVNEFVTPDIDSSDPLLSEIGFVGEPTFDDDEVLRNVLKREAASIKEADEVKDLFLNLQQQTKRLEKTFENSLVNLDFGVREFGKGLQVLDMDGGGVRSTLSKLNSVKHKTADISDEYSNDDMEIPPISTNSNSEEAVQMDHQIRSSQTLDMSEIRKALVQVKKDTTSKAKEEQMVANVRRSLNNMERIRAAQQYSKQTSTTTTTAEHNDLHLTKLNTDQHEAEVEQFLQMIHSARSGEKKRPPSSVGGGSVLKVKRNNKQ